MSSGSSPVAIRMTLTALPITSAGRRSPLGPRGIQPSPGVDYDELRQIVWRELLASVVANLDFRVPFAEKLYVALHRCLG
jgi:hypothetical protein